MYSTLKTFIERHDVITIFSHVYPDGDALGSMIGMRELIKTTYPHKSVFVLGENLPQFIPLIGEVDVVSDETVKASAALILDVADSARVFEERFKLAHASFKLDHHIFVETFTDFEIVNNERIAVCEMVGEFLLNENLAINELGATALALGIMTDSGRFSYDLTSALTFEIMAALLRYGANFKKINEELAKRSLDGLKVRGYFMSNYTTDKNVIYHYVPYSKLYELGLKASDGSKFVNMYGNFEGYPLWATFFTDENGIVFCELRSKTHNVQAVAKAFGGGGHLKASGCRLESESKVAEVIAALHAAKEII